MNLDFEKTEQYIFQNSAIRRLLPEFSHLYDQYSLGIRIPALRQNANRAILEFLEKVQDHHLKIINEELEMNFEKNNLNFKIVIHHNFILSDICEEICEIKSLNDFCIYRKEDKIELTLWR